MSLELANVIRRVVKDFKVCQKFPKSVSQPKVTSSKASSFNEIVTMDLKSFGLK